MRLFAAVVALLATSVLAASSSVKVLTTENFDETIKNNENVIVEFFAPWCGHCKTLAPHYEKAAKTLFDEGIVLASVDATVYAELGNKFDVKGYPTLKVFKNGVVSEYKGGRTEDTIVSYARKTFGPPAVEIEDLKKAKDAKVAVVAFLAEKSGPEYDAFIAHAKTDQDIPYYYTTSAELAQAEGVTVPGVKLFKSFDEKFNVLDTPFTQENIATFVTANSVPTVIPFSMEVVQEIFGSKVGRAAFLFRNSEQASALDAIVHKVASAFRGLAVFTTADYSEPRLNQYIGVDAATGPHFIIVETPQGGAIRRFPLSLEVIEENLSKLLHDYKSGSLKPTLKSDPIPESNDGNVKVIVGKNFESIVMDPTKDVLLEVYAPWCGHCKKLEPTWNELGAAFAKDSSVVIAKMDGTTNEVDGLSAQSFPTILFYPAGTKTVAGTPYEGGRDLSNFKDFILQRKAAAGGESQTDAHDEL